ncbi:MAG: DNA-directed RNA polymerase subunit beta' [Chloroflexi bacterium]|nr:DNA-directed RNA polymerase subunit beta' [Chloroflexota bacterium]
MVAQAGNEFNAIRISLASPEQIRTWSYGEVTKPETINYRTLRPEKDGLFCERIFGPTKDWECYCGKYKKIRYKGVICDRCGVEIARSKVRRERMGHISLAAPVAHIWFSKGTPSRLGLLLDLSPRNLEKVLYFAQYLVTSVDEPAREVHVKRLQEEMEEVLAQIDAEVEAKLEQLPDAQSKSSDDEESKKDEQLDSPEARKIKDDAEERKAEVENTYGTQIEDLQDLRVSQLFTESRYRELREKYDDVFTAGMGAESVLEVMRTLDLEAMRGRLQEEVRTTSGQRRKKAIKSLRVVEAFRKSGNKPEWMVWTVLPVLPPELRPMVQLDGGRFATSDLNDLYRRVINRNNRLKRLIELQAPEIIIRNEKRMLQEAVDALVDNGRRGRAVSGSHNHKLKSLSDLLRGKQGRFRQNLLGKRVDYSGRSVIVVGPTMQLHQCGIPRRMALELFKPFVMHKLVVNGFAHNIKSAKRMAERARPEVWDILEEVIKDRPVLLNRAPTLHRLGIQAFQPILVEGSAIQVHPLVCTAFNADFDGDQMAVHVPLSKEAVLEAKRLMLSVYNMLSPSSGDPIVAPTLDMVLGCYYMTILKEGQLGSGKVFASFEDARLAYEYEQIGLHAAIKVLHPPANGTSENGAAPIETTVGRIIFNEVLPAEMGNWNQAMDRGALKDLTAMAYRRLDKDGATGVLDRVKDLGFRYATKSGATIAINDLEVSEEKGDIIAEADKKITQLEQQFLDGLITEDERYNNAVQVWTAASDKLTKVVEATLRNYSGISLMASSGAKGNIAQIKQMAGMRGLMSDPKGRIIEWPIKSNFREGLTVLEYFISTHGARKGLADTALRTADSGYLTRRLIDVSQEIVIAEDDCETESGIWIEEEAEGDRFSPFTDRIKSRFTAAPIAHPDTGEVLVDRNVVIDENVVAELKDTGVKALLIRSPLVCETERGVCRKCYGLDLATGGETLIGQAVGIIAAQSIGEPGTQLTMRTFHTGGIAGADITTGLPRVEELFEARTPKGEAILSEIDGAVEVLEDIDGRTVRVSSTEEFTDEYPLTTKYEVLVADGDYVAIGTPLAELKSTKKSKKDEEATALQSNDLIARVSGQIKLKKKVLTITWTDEETREYVIPAASHIVAQSGDSVVAGQALTGGPKNPQQILRIQGREAVQQYLIDEVQKVYRSQGVKIHDKHIEVIASQMLRKVRIDSPGDTDLLPGELVDRRKYEEINASILAEGGEPATASPVLLGITRASLNMDSFLAAASFQETTRVLTEAAVNGEVDHLRGLKENVIIGRLIPARLDATEEGRERLGLNELIAAREQAEREEQEYEEEMPIGILSDSSPSSNGESAQSSEDDSDGAESDSDGEKVEESLDESETGVDGDDEKQDG